MTAPVRKDEFGRLHPRGSFNEFVENVTDRSRMWSEHDRIAADTLYQAVHSGLNEWAYRQLAIQATIDPLTGLGNRRALSLAVDSEIRSQSASRRFALLFLDLDRFKQINDVYGHQKGDLVLRATADRLERVTFYLVARFGSVFRLGVTNSSCCSSMPRLIWFRVSPRASSRRSGIRWSWTGSPTS